MTDVKSLYHNFGAAASVEFLSQGAVFYHSLSDLVSVWYKHSDKGLIFFLNRQ